MITPTMTLYPNLWMLGLVVRMLTLRPLELGTASIADDVGIRDVNLHVGYHISTGSGHSSAVGPVASELLGLSIGLLTNVSFAYMFLY
jgi:hypothetical protein